MAHIPALLFVITCLAGAGCDTQPVKTASTHEGQQARVNKPPTPAHIQNAEENEAMASNFEGLCRITNGVHIPAPTKGNRSTSRSNGTNITVIGSKSQSLSSTNGKALVTVSGAAILHVEFPTGELISIEINESLGRVEVSIDGPTAISCTVAT